MDYSKLSKAELLELVQNAATTDTAKTGDSSTGVVANTFKYFLQRDNKTIRGDRATRIAESANMDYVEMINSKKKEIFSLENSIEAMSDLSTSNTTTTSNRIGEFTFDSAEFVRRRSDLLVKITIAKQTLAILLNDAQFYGN